MNDIASARAADRPLETAATGVAYVRAGEGAPLVLFHGGAGSWTHWIRSIDALSARFAVFALDLPGYGASFAPPRDIPADDYFAIVRETVDEITGRAPVHLSGFSFGSFIATAVAAALGERARAFSLIGASGFEPPVGRDVHLESIRGLRERLGREPTAAEVTELHRNNLAELMIWDRAKIDDLAIALQAENVANTRFDSRRLSWSGRMPEFMAQVRCPVKMIYGEHDRSAYPSVGARLSQCQTVLPGIETEVMADCGHWTMYEAPERTNRLLLEFHGRS